jgi:hypothetical protein
MPFPILSLLVAAVVLAATCEAASAQSPYSYPWCARYFTRGTPTGCYYASRELCMQTISGIGGYCYLNPGYQGSSTSVARPLHKRRRVPS